MAVKPRPLSLRLRLLSALLAVLVLASSVGLTAERHRCRISGRRTVTLLLPGQAAPADEAANVPAQPGRACGKSQSAAAKRRPSGCCDVSHALLKLDAKRHAGPAAKLLPTPPQLAPALLPAPAWAGWPAASRLPVAVATGTAGGPSPPGWPRAGRTLLTFGCTLVV